MNRSKYLEVIKLKKYMIEMQENPQKNKYWPTTFRVLLFCILCAIALAVSSGFIPGKKGSWFQLEAVVISADVALPLTILFARWEKIKLNDVGIVPNRKSFSKYLTGLGVGLLLAALQPALVLITGHVKLLPVPDISYNTVIAYFLLYLAIGVREEVAFRGYPLFSLNRAAGHWFALLVVGIIFIAEHIAGGMSVGAAIWGSGAGSLLFGFAALKTKGLALPIGLHSAWNFGQWAFGFKNETGPFHIIIEKGYEGRIEIIGWVSYLLVMGLAIFVMYNSWKKKIV